MTSFEIVECVVPETVDAPDAADFRASVAITAVTEREGYGTDDFALEPIEVLPGWRDPAHPKRLFGARVDGTLVAKGSYSWLVADTTTAWLRVDVLPEHRRAGIGTALAERLESIAIAEGRGNVVAYAVSPPAEQEGAPRLDSPTGFGSVPADNREVRFLIGRGYTLEQVERASRLPLPIDATELRDRITAASLRAGDDYRLHFWAGPTPAQWLEDVALLQTRMSTDAPSAGLDEPEDVWTVERLVATEERDALSPRTPLTAVVEHTPTGRLVGFTVLDAPAELHRSVEQWDTLVLREHRGHGLGMLLKVANLEHLQQRRPGHPSITTFNAEENRFMLDVNEAVGFRPMGYEGAWKKVLR